MRHVGNIKPLYTNEYYNVFFVMDLREYLSNKALVRVEGLRVLVGRLVGALRPSRTRPRSQRRRLADLRSQWLTFSVNWSLIILTGSVAEPSELINTFSKVSTIYTKLTIR